MAVYHRVELVLQGQRHVLQVGVLLLQVVHLALQRRVLLLQEASPHGDLVLLQPPRLPAPLGRLVVLVALGPVLVVLQLIGHELFLPLADDRLGLQLLLGEAAGGRVKVLGGNRVLTRVLTRVLSLVVKSSKRK